MGEGCVFSSCSIYKIHGFLEHVHCSENKTHTRTVHLTTALPHQALQCMLQCMNLRNKLLCQVKSRFSHKLHPGIIQTNEDSVLYSSADELYLKYPCHYKRLTML